jgi:hypothetical protein
MGLKIDSLSLDRLCENLTTHGLDFSAIELRILSQMQSCSSIDALAEDMKVSSLELSMDLIRKAKRRFDSSGC